ncbi:filamin-binding LIM protein 1 [Oryzias melastigma]|uniref:Filamin binding LIM protein 1 n=1 Tax=Oryzias melastigma TaxID=30732 RepID=A0A3B3BDI5_ORYME|nr:filamin-binding LIM protein 1 [Oryzias melastigma]
MASAAPPKRMVSSVFITLAPPHRATVTQRQPSLKAYSLQPGAETQDTPSRAGPAGSLPVFRRGSEDHSPSDSCGSVNGKSRTRAKAWTPAPARTGLQENVDQTKIELFPPPPPPPPPLDVRHPSPQTMPSEAKEAALLPAPPAQTPSHHHPDQQPIQQKEMERITPPYGIREEEKEESNGIRHTTGEGAGRESSDLCGFCRKPIALFETAIEALNRTYHAGCFQCRSCHIPLAGKLYYNKAMIPICEECYQASLELCWACGEAIIDDIIHALERPYHPSCFTCTTCHQQIGEQTFAQGEVGEVYCILDYYRKYAPECGVCNQLIIPKEDGTDSYIVECLGRSYHENCFRCEVCVIKLPHEHGCYPLDGKLLCKPCHVNLASGVQ